MKIAPLSLWNLIRMYTLLVFKELVQADIKPSLGQQSCSFSGDKELLTSLSYLTFCLQMPNQLGSKPPRFAKDMEGLLWEHRQ